MVKFPQLTPAVTIEPMGWNATWHVSENDVDEGKCFSKVDHRLAVLVRSPTASPESKASHRVFGRVTRSTQRLGHESQANLEGASYHNSGRAEDVGVAEGRTLFVNMVRDGATTVWSVRGGRWWVKVGCRRWSMGPDTST